VVVDVDAYSIGHKVTKCCIGECQYIAAVHVEQLFKVASFDDCQGTHISGANWFPLGIDGRQPCDFNRRMIWEFCDDRQAAAHGFDVAAQC